MIDQLIDNRYHIQELIGRGGMGTVYRALDTTENQVVAVKFLQMDIDAETAPTRFYREFRVLTRLDHPHIVKALAYGVYQENPYLVLEFLEGETLQDELGKGAIERSRLLRIGRQISEALSYLHKRGLVHRDLKPGNLMLLPSEKFPHVKLMDFGLVRVKEYSVQLTQEGSALGTVTYMSPEQAQGYGVDFRSDLYALGIVLYEMATGRPPFVHENQATVLLQQITTNPPSPRHFKPDLDQALADFILDLLRKEPASRPANTQLVTNHLAQLLDETAPLTPAMPVERGDLIPRMPLIGREEVLIQIGQTWNKVKDGQGQLILMKGSVGMGKARILAEARHQAHLKSKQFLRGRNREQGSLPYQPFIDILEVLVETLSIDEKQRLPAELSRLLPSISHIPRSKSNVDQSEARLQLFNACWEVLHRKAEAIPLMISLEDMQWADPSTLELVNYLAHRIEQSRLLLILTYRREEVKSGSPLDALVRDLTRTANALVLMVEPLNKPQVGMFLRLALGQERIPEWLVDSFFRTTGGNPLFIEETLKVLMAEGEIAEWRAQDSGFWATISQPGMTLQLPQSILDLAERRLNSLPSDEKSILTTAAVLGPEFSFELLQNVTKSDEEELIDAVDWLLTSRFLEELPLLDGEDRYGFMEESLRQSLLTTISRRRLRLLHKRTGEAIESLYGGDKPRYWPQLAYHFHEAGQQDAALKYFICAGEASAKVYAYMEAVSYFTTAIELSKSTEATEEQLLTVYTQCGRNLELNSLFNEALHNYAGMCQVAKEKGMKNLELAALMAQATVQVTPTAVHDVVKGRELSEQALAVAREIGNREAEAKSLWNLLMGHTNEDPQQAIIYGEQAIAIARELDLKEQLAFTLNDINWTYQAIGQSAKAQEALYEAHQLWKELDNMPLLADTLTNLGGIHFMRGEFQQALQMTEEAYNVSAKINNTWGQAFSRWPVGYTWMARGNPDKAVAAMLDGIRLSEESGLVRPQITTRSDLAWVYGQLGDLNKALELAQDADTRAKEVMPEVRFYTQAILARLCVLQGDLAQAKQILDAHAGNIAIENATSLTIFIMVMASLEYAFAIQDYDKVVAETKEVLTVMRTTAMKPYEPDVMLLQGRALLALGDIGKAKDVLIQACKIAEEIESYRSILPALLTLIQLAKQQNDQPLAQKLQADAKEIADHIAENISDIDLQDAFTNLPHIQAIRE